MKSQDIRLNILRKIEQENRGTAEFIANDYLATVHSDLGTIKRALIDLLDDEYIRESNLSWPSQKANSIIFNINTQGPAGSPQKDSNRLLNKADIRAIRLYISLKGKRFLIEEENLKRTTWSIKYDIPLKLAYLLIGAALALIGSCVEARRSAPKSVGQLSTQEYVLPGPADNANTPTYQENDSLILESVKATYEKRPQSNEQSP